jgi:hypothetical protein
MDNSQMKSNRYGKWYTCKVLYTNIMAELDKGLSIQITNYLRSTIYSHKSQFKYDSTGVYVARGKRWDCILGNNIRSIRY